MGAAVPQVRNEDGTIFHSLRREPTLFTALGEACFGARWPSRPAALSDTVRSAQTYTRPGPAEWASGAALVISIEADRLVGDWDERFFLYSEETDWARRLRAAYLCVWYGASAVCVHEGGGSGASPALDALQQVNRLRDYEAHHGFWSAQAFRAVLAAHQILRPHRPGSRLSLRMLLDRSAWHGLPAADEPPLPPERRSDRAHASVVIPAHNEARVIGRLLDGLSDGGLRGGTRVVVACNGCVDETAAVARSYADRLDLVVIESEVADKKVALDAADQEAGHFPRAYIDADVEVSGRDVTAVLDVLDTDRAVAARPSLRYDTTGASGVVRASYRARARTPELMTALWGAGFYAVSAQGRSRWGRWDAADADDMLVASHFSGNEVIVVQRAVVTVRPPRDVGTLIRTLQRVYRRPNPAGATSADDARTRTSGTLLALVRSNCRGLRSSADLVVYVAIAVSARIALAGRSLRRQQETWERDSTTR